MNIAINSGIQSSQLAMTTTNKKTKCLSSLTLLVPNYIFDNESTQISKSDLKTTIVSSADSDFEIETHLGSVFDNPKSCFSETKTDDREYHYDAAIIDTGRLDKWWLVMFIIYM